MIYRNIIVKTFMNAALEEWLGKHEETEYSRTSVARTLMARLPRLLRTRS